LKRHKITLFRIALAMEKEDWKPFCNALNKSNRKEFDEMMMLFDLYKFYISACSNSVEYVRETLCNPYVYTVSPLKTANRMH
jgi:hypothetical protein